MSDDTNGVRKTDAQIKKKDSEFYSTIGKKGGSAKVPKGFAKNLELASSAGKIGGQNSRRRKIEVHEETDDQNAL